MAPTAAQALEVARKTVNIYEKHGLKCCLFGSVASYLYGVARTPNDVDLVVLSEGNDQEALKELLVREDPRFYLVRSKNRFATYRVLWYRLSASVFPRPSVDCKVDILRPGIMAIPAVPPEHVVTLAGLPVMPLVPQLLLKLQGWSDHRSSHRTDMRLKQYVDIADVDALLQIAVEKGAVVRAEELEGWLPESMLTIAERRVRGYNRYATRNPAQWRKLGLNILG